MNHGKEINAGNVKDKQFTHLQSQTAGRYALKYSIALKSETGQWALPGQTSELEPMGHPGQTSELEPMGAPRANVRIRKSVFAIRAGRWWWQQYSQYRTEVEESDSTREAPRNTPSASIPSSGSDVQGEGHLHDT